jgi:hypothetical protein
MIVFGLSAIFRLAAASTAQLPLMQSLDELSVCGLEWFSKVGRWES